MGRSTERGIGLGKKGGKTGGEGRIPHIEREGGEMCWEGALWRGRHRWHGVYVKRQEQDNRGERH